MMPLGVLFDSFNQLLERPVPLGRRRSHPERQKLSSIGVNRSRRYFFRRIGEFRLEMVAEHLKRRKLANEVRIDSASIEEEQNVADIAKLREGIAETARLSE